MIIWRSNTLGKIKYYHVLLKPSPMLWLCTGAGRVLLEIARPHMLLLYSASTRSIYDIAIIYYEPALCHWVYSRGIRWKRVASSTLNGSRFIPAGLGMFMSGPVRAPPRYGTVACSPCPCGFGAEFKPSKPTRASPHNLLLNSSWMNGRMGNCLKNVWNGM